MKIDYPQDPFAFSEQVNGDLTQRLDETQRRLTRLLYWAAGIDPKLLSSSQRRERATLLRGWL